MATLQEPQFNLEAGGGCGDESHRRSGSSDDSDESSTITTEIKGLVPEEKRTESSVSEFTVVDLESGGGGAGDEGSKLHVLKVEKDCRICHLSLSLDVNSEDSGNGFPIELGCSCKDDLAAAHNHCAEAWFKIKGNRTCEICGSTARNVAGTDEDGPIDQWDELNGSTPSRAIATGEPMTTSEHRNFWQGHRFLNFLLASMVFAFVISWLFHFNVPS